MESNICANTSDENNSHYWQSKQPEFQRKTSTSSPTSKPSSIIPNDNSNTKTRTDILTTSNKCYFYFVKSLQFLHEKCNIVKEFSIKSKYIKNMIVSSIQIQKKTITSAKLNSSFIPPQSDHKFRIQTLHILSNS
jgi:hypothetical protein